MDYNKIKKAVDNMIEKQDRLEYFLKRADIEEAIDNMIEKWDLNTLKNFVFQYRLEYFLKSADKEEVIELLKEYG